jgi:hypothetical protein
MASPSMTGNALGNIESNQTISTSGSLTFALNFSTKFEGQTQIQVTFGTVSATSGLQVSVYRAFGASQGTADTIVITQFTIPGLSSTTSNQSFALPTGWYSVTLTNLDASHSVTGVYVTTNTIDSIA